MLLFGVLTPLPVVVFGSDTLPSILMVFVIIGLVMSIPYGWPWLKGGTPKEAERKGAVLSEYSDSDGKMHRIYHPDGSRGWSPPLNKGINRSLDSRMTIWREVSWVAPVTFGDIVLTWIWNALLLFTGRTHGRLSRRRDLDDAADPEFG